MSRPDARARKVAATPLYVYGIIRAEDARALGPIGLEVNGAPGEVTTVTTQGIAAVVSQVSSSGRVLPMRKNIDAQNRVLRELLAAPGGVIPLRFGHVVKGEQDVCRLLGPRRVQVTKELGLLAGRVEMALRVVITSENVFEYVVRGDEDLAAERDRIFLGGRDAGRQEKIDLGRAFAARVEELRAETTQIVTEAIVGARDAVKVIDAHSDECMLDLAILVKRSQLPALEARIDEVASRLPDAYECRYTGPFAPFHFVGLELNESGEEE